MDSTQEPEDDLLQSLPLGQVLVSTTWNGAPITLQTNQSVNMSSTPTGSMLLLYQNISPENNQGEFHLTSGGGNPHIVPAPPLTNQVGVYNNNWKGNNLVVSNTSNPGVEVPIWFQALGPGMPGQHPKSLMVGQTLALQNNQSAQGNTSGAAQLALVANSGLFSVIGVIGGPTQQGNNAYVIALNSSQNSGPTPGQRIGYYAQTSNNSYILPVKWGSSVIWVANLSPQSQTAVQITLR